MVIFLLLYSGAGHAWDRLGGECGFPGTPANGSVSPVAESPPVAEGTVAQYSCDPGFVLFGDLQRECLPNSTWTGEIPTCDLNLSLHKKASQSESFFNYTADLAVDGHLETCSFTPQTTDTRWWQVHLGAKYTVAAVAVTVGTGVFHKFTVFVVSLGAGDKMSYEPCGSFDGIFESDTVVLVCNQGQGQIGQLIFVRDDRPRVDYFGLCEVEVFSRRDQHPCGRPEVPLHGHASLVVPGSVDFDCSPGFRLVGPSHLSCFEGRWTGSTPACAEVACDVPAEIPNGVIHFTSSERFLAGAVANYSCELGYVLVGNSSRTCDPSGVWTGDAPHCEPVDCGSLPLVRHGVLVANASTSGAVGVLQCDEGFQPVGETHVLCGHLGQWLVENATCRDPVAPLEGELPGLRRENESSSGVVIGSIVAIIMTLAAIVIIAYLRRRWLSRNGKADEVSEAIKSCSPTASHSGMGDPIYDDVFYSNGGFNTDATGGGEGGSSSMDDGLYADAGLIVETARIYDSPAGDDDEPIYYTPVEMKCGNDVWAASGAQGGHENPVYEPLDASRLDGAIYARVDKEKKKKDREESFRRQRGPGDAPADDGLYENMEVSPEGGLVSTDGPKSVSLDSLSPLPSPRPLPPIPSESSLSVFETMDNELYSTVPAEPEDDAQWETSDSIYAAVDMGGSSGAIGGEVDAAPEQILIGDAP